MLHVVVRCIKYEFELHGLSGTYMVKEGQTDKDMGARAVCPWTRQTGTPGNPHGPSVMLFDY